MDKWPKKYNRILLLWLNQISVNRLTHYKLSLKLKNYHNIIIFTTIILSTISGSTSFINIYQFSSKIKIALNVIIGALAVIAAILISFNSHFKFNEHSIEHLGISNEYSSINNMIQETLINEKKPNFSEFTSKITSMIEMIQRYSPPTDGIVDIADLPHLVLIKNPEKDEDENDIIHESDIALFISGSNTASSNSLKDIRVDD